MRPFISHFYELFKPRTIGWGEWLVQWLDVLLVAYLIYRLLMLVRGTRGWRVILGVMAFLILMVGSQVLGFSTLNWIMEKALLLGPVALVILFLPELRQGLEDLGRLGRPIQRLVTQEQSASSTRTIDELARALIDMSEEHVGALVVIDKGANLDDILKSGVELQARVSAPLIESLFYEGNPLHDGAVVLRGDTLVSAGCRLPLSESSRLDQNVHMRHRAAVGVTELFDCLALVVSEERGSISYATEGRLRRLNHPAEIRDVLIRELRGDQVLPPPRVRRAERKKAPTEVKS